jgi:aldehyde:ferredoxin oxidoreductase
VVRLEDGAKRKGPEYETLVGFGPNLMLNDPVLATRLGELCDRYGMDSISLSNTIGLAFQLYEMGKVTSQDTGGLELVWGNAPVVEQLVHMTVRRQGFGDCLANGARSLGRRFGAEEEAVQVNGLEVAYHDPRGASGMALVYATSPRGACHNQSDYFFVDLGQVEASLGMEFHDRHGGPEKAANVAIHQNWRTVFNALVMCIFSNVSPETVVGLINAACGYQWTVKEMLKAGERGWNLKRAINHRLGLTGANDRLPMPLQQPYTDCLPREECYAVCFEEMLAAYYEARDWDPATGFPTRGKLEELGLDFVIKDLYP